MDEIVISAKQLEILFGTHTALRNINFDIPSGDFVSIVGPNGGGKSTLLKSLLGLLPISSGEIKIYGQRPQNLEKGIISYVPQVKTLDRSFPALSIELAASGIHARWPALLDKNDKKLAFEALEKVGAQHLAKRPLNKLSGGELQRIYLAKAIIRKPKILLLDEPATGIDLVGEKDINHLIDEYKSESNVTIMMVTHDWEAAYHHADKVLLLNCEQVCFATPREAFKEKNLRKAFRHVGHEHDMIFGVRNHD